MRGRGFVHQEEVGEDDRGGCGPEPGAGPPQKSWDHENQPFHFNINKVMMMEMKWRWWWWLVLGCGYRWLNNAWYFGLRIVLISHAQDWDDCEQSAKKQ